MLVQQQLAICTFKSIIAQPAANLLLSTQSNPNRRIEYFGCSSFLKLRKRLFQLHPLPLKFSYQIALTEFDLRRP